MPHDAPLGTIRAGSRVRRRKSAHCIRADGIQFRRTCTGSVDHLGHIPAVMALGAPVARCVGDRLSCTRSLGVHLTAYTLLGIAVGGIYLLVAGCWWGWMRPGLHLFAWAPAVAAAIAVPLGWWWTARRILRRDAMAPVKE